MEHILFICTGNTCRSPMAAEMMRQLAKEYGIELEVRSAGIAAYDGVPASSHTQAILREKGWDEIHSSQMIREEHLEWADLILTMTQYHRDAIRSVMNEGEDQLVYTLKEYAMNLTQEQEGMKQLDIQDPFGGDLETYRQCGEEIERILHRILKKWTDD
jgi:protein-tyrosine-phosphatase